MSFNLIQSDDGNFLRGKSTSDCKKHSPGRETGGKRVKGIGRNES